MTHSEKCAAQWRFQVIDSPNAQSFGEAQHLRHAKADTTANEYMQELPDSVKQMVDSVYGELRAGRKRAAGSVYLLPNATKRENRMAARGDLLPNATKRQRGKSVSD